MKIKWLGHSCFLITTSKGYKILTDPYDHTVGYKVENIDADIVTISHEHFDHNYRAMLKNMDKAIFLDKPGSFSFKDGLIEVKGVSTFHDSESGAKRGKNTVFVFGIEGIKICHCGDLGHILTEIQIEEIGKVDILMVPVGGIYTIDYREASIVCSLLKPRWIIPMHYKTEMLKFSTDGVDKFLKVMDKFEVAKEQEFFLDMNAPDKGAHKEGIILLDYKNN